VSSCLSRPAGKVRGEPKRLKDLKDLFLAEQPSNSLMTGILKRPQDSKKPHPETRTLKTVNDKGANVFLNFALGKRRLIAIGDIRSGDSNPFVASG